jgi:hypothetical protein
MDKMKTEEQKQKSRENAKRWRENHREKYLEINRKNVKRYSQEHPEYRKNYIKSDAYKEMRKKHDRKYHITHREYLNQKRNEYRKKFPERRKAQDLAQEKIELKSFCEICGDTKNLERHHWRYDKPLMVSTLCRYCHIVQHHKDFSKYPELLVGVN